MFGNTIHAALIHAALIHAATRYDVRQSKGKRYNPYALAQYFRRIEEAEQDIAKGATPRNAILAAFSGSLCDAMLRAIDQPPSTKDERDGKFGIVTYQPAAAR